MIPRPPHPRLARYRRGPSEWALLTALLCLCALPGASAPAETTATGESDEPVLDLTARGSFDVPRVRSGDTIQYRLRVEWNDVPAAVMVLPPRDDLETPGLRITEQSTSHRKIREGEETRNLTEFTYTLVAGAPGTAKVSPFTLRYRSGLSSREESVAVTGTMLEVLSPRTAPWARPVYWLILVPVIAAAAVPFLRRRRGRTVHGHPPPQERLHPSLRRRLESLKRRCDNDKTDSRAWISGAERLCVEHLCRRLGVSNPGNVRFEAALDRYLSRKPGPGSAEAASWAKLRDLFHETRYTGGTAEPQVLRDACRHLKTCLQPGEEKPS